jgi:4-amino-4-deoxy-L-arabinose transferase-like glycosyltransferase
MNDALRSQRIAKLLLPGAILLVAFAFRVARLDQVPPGLSHDEAYNGVTALEILRGRHAVFFDIKNGTEALFLYFQAGAISLLGTSDWAMRWVSVFFGLLTISLTCALAHRFFDRRVALLAGLGLALSFWAVFVSRLALRAVALPAFEVAAFFCYWEGMHATTWRKSLLYYGLTGVLVGSSIYTYLSSRFLPLVFLLYYLYQAIRMRRLLLPAGGRRSGGTLGLALLLVVGTIVFVPLGYYFYTHPGTFATRAGQVNDLRFIIWSGDFGPLLNDTLRTLGMFGQQGDPSWRYNAAGRPIFDLPGVLLFYFGVGVCLVRAGKAVLRGDGSQGDLSVATTHRANILPAADGGEGAGTPEAFCLIWLFVMLVPGFITGESPHFLRVIGALPVTYILWGVGLVLAWDLVRGRLGRWGRNAFLIGFVAWLALTVWWTYRDYFNVWAGAEEARYIYGADFGEMARYLKRTHYRSNLYISAEYYKDLDRFRFDLLMNRRMSGVKWFDGRRSLVLPPPERDEDTLYLFPASAPAQPALARRALRPVEDVGPGSAFSAYRPRPDADLAATYPVDANLVDVVHITGVDLEGPAQAGRQLGVILYWQVIRGVVQNLNLTFFIHLVDEHGYLWAQADANDYAPADWRPGDRVLQWVELDLPPDMPPRRYRLVAGMFDLSSGERLSVLDAQGHPVGAEVDLGTFEVARAAVAPDPATLGIPTAAKGQFGDLFAFLGYGVAPQILNRGERAHVSLYWRVLADPGRDYFLAPAAVDESGRMRVLPYRQPLDGDYPTGRWHAGQVVRDCFDIPIGADWDRGLYHLYVGWRDPDTGELLPLEGSATPAISLGDIFVRGRERIFSPPPISNSQRADFGGQVALLGYDLGAEQVRPGERLGLTLYWQAEKLMDVSYTVFTHLLDNQNMVWGQQDNPPDEGSYPTTGWSPGEVVVDRYAIPLRPDAPPGRYVLEIGLYDAATGQRLPVINDAGEVVDDRVVLGQVVVAP